MDFIFSRRIINPLSNMLKYNFWSMGGGGLKTPHINLLSKWPRLVHRPPRDFYKGSKVILAKNYAEFF